MNIRYTLCMQSTSSRYHCGICETLYIFIGRVSIGSLFLFSGIAKLYMVEGVVSTIASLSLPYPELIAYTVIGIEIVFGLLVVIGLLTHISASFLALFTILTILLIHNSFSDTSLLKNLAILGGLCYILGHGPGRISTDYFIHRTTPSQTNKTDPPKNEITL